MFTRISSISALALLLASCGLFGEDQAQGPKGTEKGATVPLDDPLAQAEAQADQKRSDAQEAQLNCAVSGSKELAPVCDVERSETVKGLLLTVRHPDGGFRRLLVVQDGRGVVAADGAEEAVVTPIGAREIEVALAGNRYRLPATVKGK